MLCAALNVAAFGAAMYAFIALQGDANDGQRAAATVSNKIYSLKHYKSLWSFCIGIYWDSRGGLPLRCPAIAQTLLIDYALK